MNLRTAYYAIPKNSEILLHSTSARQRRRGDLGRPPRVSIGLPVYNGEQFVAETIESILAQTYPNFELIICDNASTDRTEALCREYAAKDERIRYMRNATNLGAARNYNLTVELATGEYFKWAAADDLIAPEYLEMCVKVLDANPDVLVCHSKSRFIDENGMHLRDHEDLLDFRDKSASERYARYLFRRAGGWSAILGLMRLAELRKTALHGAYLAADKILLGELILRGQLFQLPQRLLSRRRHAQQSWQANRTKQALSEWFDPENRNRLLLPTGAKLLVESMRSIRRSPLSPGTALMCYKHAIVWGARMVIGGPLKGKLKRVIRRHE